MTAETVKCPNCGANLKIGGYTQTQNCDFCGSTLTITNPDAPALFNMDDFAKTYDFTRLSNNEVAITKYKTSYDAHLSIPEKIGDFSIVEIGQHSFAGHTELKSVVFPKTIKIIRRMAFYEKPTGLFGAFANMASMNLSKVEFHEGLHTIEDDAFTGCPLENTVFPKSLVNLSKTWNGTDLSKAMSFSGQGDQKKAANMINQAVGGMVSKSEVSKQIGAQLITVKISEPYKINTKKKIASFDISLSWNDESKDYALFQVLSAENRTPKTKAVKVTFDKKHIFKCTVKSDKSDFLINPAYTLVRFIVEFKPFEKKMLSSKELAVVKDIISIDVKNAF
jgi:hypothetical protein